MINFEMIDLIWISPLLVSAGVITSALYACYYDWKNPPEPIRYTWHNIWPDYKGDWERGHATKIYYNTKNHDIRGKVVMQKDGLYLATMYNGEDKEFMLDSLAQKWVEQYKPRIYK